MYNPVFTELTKWSPPEPSYTYEVVTKLLTVSPRLSFTSLGLFCDYQSYFLILSPFSPTSPTPFPSDNCQNVLCIYESVSILLHLFWFLGSMSKWNHTAVVFLCLTYFKWNHNGISLALFLSAQTLRSIHVADGKTSFFLWLSYILLYISTTSSLSIHLLIDF